MRIALGIEYQGHHFFGWQVQENLLTVQGCLEKALSQVADEPIKLFCAGRTDTGVHAYGQVAHFDTNAVRSLRAWVLGVNTYLPNEIAVKWAEEVDGQFHARFSAVSRCYRYIIYNNATRSALFAKHTTWYRYSLNIELMHKAGEHLLGEQDFSSFRSAGCESKSPMRHVEFMNVTRQGDFVILEIQANAFLHHMVRNIAGVLLCIGSGLRQPEWMQEILQAKDRTQAAETASPTGLYLYKVNYPEEYCFPENNRFCYFF